LFTLSRGRISFGFKNKKSLYLQSYAIGLDFNCITTILKDIEPLHFDNGDVNTKTAIIRSLGLNFYIKDGKVLIELSKPFLILKENHGALENEVKSIELNKEVGIITQNQNFQYQFPTLWRCPELNRSPRKHL